MDHGAAPALMEIFFVSGVLSHDNPASIPRSCSLTDILTRKLANFAPLSSDGRRLLVEFAGLGRRLDTHTDLIREGDRPDREGNRPDDVRLVLEGFAYRYKILTDGRRHIMAYLISGDLYDMHVFHPQGNGSQHRYCTACGFWDT